MKNLTSYLNIGVNTFFQIASRASTALVALLVTRLLASQLGLTGYGQYQVIIVFASFFWVFTDFGLNILAVREMSSATEKLQDYFSSLLTLRVSLSLVMIFLALSVLAFLPYPPVLKVALIIGTLTILLQALSGVATTVFQVKAKYIYFFLANLAGSLLLLGTIFVALYLGGSVVSLSLAMVSGYAFTAGLSLFFAAKFVRLRFSLDWPLLKDLIFKTLPFGVALILNITAYSQDAFLLSFVKTTVDNAKAVGIYNLAYKFFELSIVIPGYFVNVLYPILNQQYSGEKFAQVEKSFLSSATLLLIGGLAGTAVLVFLSPWLVSLLTGSNEFADSVSVLRILALALPASFLLPLLMHFLLILRRQSWLIVVYGIAWLVNLVANLIFIPTYKYFAPATITVFTEWFLLALFVFAYFYLWRKNLVNTNNETD